MINGKNVYLRLPELTDLEAIYELANTEENRGFLNFYRPMSKIEEENWIKHKIEEAGKGNAYVFAIMDKQTNGFLGVCELFNIDKIARLGTIGITLNKKNQEKGMGTEALKLVLKWGFESLNLNLIIIDAISNNERALHVYKDKLKFKHEATLRNRKYKNGKYYDFYILSMTKEEYEEMYGGKE
jgi:RimJ/RimL family protein N-acetyltransferase